MEKFKHAWHNVARYLKRVFIALDQLANTLCGGWPDETISATSYRKAVYEDKLFFKVLRFLLDIVLTPIKQNHCMEAYMSEMNRTQSPKEYRQCNSD